MLACFAMYAIQLHCGALPANLIHVYLSCQARRANPTSVVCGCNHLTFFSADFMVAPNTIDFNIVFNKFADIGDNLAVLLTVIGLILLFWTGILVLRRLDKKDLEKVIMVIMMKRCSSYQRNPSARVL